MEPTTRRLPWRWGEVECWALARVAAALAFALIVSAQTAGTPRQVPPMLVVDPNTAPRMALVALPRIGPVLSQRIIDERRARPFQTVADLDRVPRIGPVTVEALRPYLRISPR